ncbi:MAG: CHASE2 domain-containing protein [Candidatus Auribacterota bacterium]
MDINAHKKKQALAHNTRLQYIRDLTISIVIGIIIAIFFNFHVLDKIEAITVDWRFRLRQNPTLNPNLVIIGITKECIDKIGGYPIPRDLYSKVVDNLTKAGAKSICFDVFFDLPGAQVENDQILAKSFKTASNITLPVFTPQKVNTSSKNKLGNMIVADLIRQNMPLYTRSIEHQGHINAIPDSDGKIRRIPFMLYNNNTIYYPMSFEAFLEYRGIDKTEVHFGKHSVVVRDMVIPLDEDNCLPINYFNPETAIDFMHLDLPDFSVDTIRFYSFSDVVDNKIPAKNFANKIVLIGQTSHGLTNADECVTPFDIIFGLFLQGSLINSYLNNEFIHRWNRLYSTFLIFIFSILIGLGISKLNFFKTTLVSTLIASLYSFIAIYLFIKFNFILEIVPIIFAIFLHFAINLVKKLQDAFSVILKKDEELGIINKVGERILDICEVSDTPSLIIENIFEALPAEAALLYIKQDDDHHSMIRKGEIFKEDCELGLKKELIEVVEHLKCTLVTTQRPIVMNDVGASITANSSLISCTLERIHSLLLVPMVVHQETIGIICLCNKLHPVSGKLVEFTNDDLTLLKSILSQSAVSLENFLLYNNLRDFFLNTIKSLVASIDAKDQYTAGHSERVTAISEMIGAEMRLTPTELENLRISAILHDVGKIGISDSILCSTSRLTDEEFEVIKSHPVKGEDILKHVNEFIGIIPGVKHHHERFDGRGYPDGLKGKDIPLTARIIAIADTFDAMTSNRTYRKRLDVEFALNEIRRCAGTQFDPELVEYFFKCYETYKDVENSPFWHAHNFIKESAVQTDDSVQSVH